jgi:hypothetical protein
MSSTAPLGTARFATVLPSLTVGATSLERTVNYVSPRYFAAVGTAILQGRQFDDRDVRGAPAVAIVDEALARGEWPGRDVVGTCVTEISLDRDAGCVQIVGISAPRRLRRLTAPVGEVFFPLVQGDAIVPRAIFVRPSVPVEQPGLIAVFWTASLSRSYLFGVTPTDVASVSSASIVLMLSGCAGALLPMLASHRAVSAPDAARSSPARRGRWPVPTGETGAPPTRSRPDRRRAATPRLRLRHAGDKPLRCRARSRTPALWHVEGARRISAEERREVFSSVASRLPFLGVFSKEGKLQDRSATDERSA